MPGLTSPLCRHCTTFAGQSACQACVSGSSVQSPVDAACAPCAPAAWCLFGGAAPIPRATLGDPAAAGSFDPFQRANEDSVAALSRLLTLVGSAGAAVVAVIIAAATAAHVHPRARQLVLGDTPDRALVCVNAGQTSTDHVGNFVFGISSFHFCTNRYQDNSGRARVICPCFCNRETILTHHIPLFCIVRVAQMWASLDKMFSNSHHTPSGHVMRRRSTSFGGMFTVACSCAIVLLSAMLAAKNLLNPSYTQTVSADALPANPRGTFRLRYGTVRQRTANKRR